MMLETETRMLGEVMIVDCRGRIQLGDETATLRQLVHELMNESRHIVLNLTDVTHIDSNGIGMLFGLHIYATKSGIVIKLVGLGDSIKKVADMTKLSTIFEVHPTVKEAVASFNPAIPQPTGT